MGEKVSFTESDNIRLESKNVLMVHKYSLHQNAGSIFC